MSENTIVQFVGFITSLEFDKFIVRWDYYVKLLKEKKMKSSLQRQSAGKNRYRYISQHAGSPEDFKFVFMKKRESEHFPEHNAKVVHIGGYIPLQVESNRHDRERNVNVMVFVKNPEADINFYRQLSSYLKLNIYQAYYENCAYAFIMEFFVKDGDAAEFMLHLNNRISNARIGDEASLYEEYAMAHA